MEHMAPNLGPHALNFPVSVQLKCWRLVFIWKMASIRRIPVPDRGPLAFFFKSSRDMEGSQERKDPKNGRIPRKEGSQEGKDPKKDQQDCKHASYGASTSALGDLRVGDVLLCTERPGVHLGITNCLGIGGSRKSCLGFEGACCFCALGGFEVWSSPGLA